MRLSKVNILAVAAFLLSLVSCNTPVKKVVNKGEESHEFKKYKLNPKKVRFAVALTELSDYEYRDNPDIGNWVKNYHRFAHDSIVFLRKKNGNFDILIGSENNYSDSVVLKNIDLKVYMPALPKWLVDDEYLALLGFTNLEWNRQQIRYMRDKSYFDFFGNGFESDSVGRIDVARNCLKTDLWEVAFYGQENGKLKPSYHGWFDFPKELYAELFQEVNGFSIQKYLPVMAHWKDPESKLVDFNKLRKLTEEVKVQVNNHNSSYYPLTGARKSKYKNIIYPKNPTSIQDFLSDSTRYSTFTPPGFYNTEDPRKTQLSKFYELIDLKVYKTIAPNSDSTHELVLFFKDNTGKKKTKIYFGGFNLDSLPVLSFIENNKGFKMPMGFSNHPFYQTYENAVKMPCLNNPYYGVIVNKDNMFLDSHTVGMDGPILFWDKDNDKLLRVMLLSFERHSFVGHFSIQF